MTGRTRSAPGADRSWRSGARLLAGLLGFVVTLGMAAQPRNALAEASAIGTGPQLLVDDVLIASQKGTVRTIHPCRKLSKPVLEPEHPWEGSRVYVYGSVLYDETLKLFRMWYMSSPTEGSRDPRLNRSRGTLVLYATSADGVRWQKSKMDLYEFNGSTENNIVCDLDSPSLIRDSFESDPSKRYKMIGYQTVKGKGSGAWACTSADGLRWRDCGSQPLFKTHDTLTFTQDPRTGEYLVFHKMSETIRGYPRRLVALATSRDLKTWSPSRLVLTPDEKDDAWCTFPGQRTEFYDMSAFSYGDQFLGLVAVFRLTRQLERGKTAPHQSSHDGPIHAELVYSRDGREWHRLDERTPIIPNGPAEFDAGCILGMINTPVVRSDEVWVYYTAITTTHGGAMPAKRITIGRAGWRRDGFVSLDAGAEGGVVETVPLRMAGNRLIVNADAAKGSLVVTVLDASGTPLPGYTGADAIEIRGDSVRHAVRWKQTDTLPVDRPIRLGFHLRQCRLYSYAVDSGPAAR